MCVPINWALPFLFPLNLKAGTRLVLELDAILGSLLDLSLRDVF